MITEAKYDVSAEMSIRFTFHRGAGAASSIVLETMPDAAGTMPSGIVDIYLNGAIGSPWRSLTMGKNRVGPVPNAQYIDIIPRAGAKGILVISTSEQNLGFGFY